MPQLVLILHFNAIKSEQKASTLSEVELSEKLDVTV